MSNNKITLRTATPDDAETLVSIYSPYVESTAISFEYEVPTAEEFRNRIEKTLQHFPYLVAELDGNIVGYAYAGKFKERAAYDKSAELSIYVKDGIHGKGIGTALYDRLEDDLRRQGITNAYACITWIDTPNEYLTHASPCFMRSEDMSVAPCSTSADISLASGLT